MTLSYSVQKEYWRFRRRGYQASFALAYARALAHAEDRGWFVDWEWEQEPDLSWCACHKARKVRHTHEVLCAVLRDAKGNVLEVLGNIVDADKNYRLEVFAELASEAMNRTEP